MYNPSEIKVFILKVANWGPHLTFHERNAINIYQGGFSTWLSAGGPALR